METPYGSSSRPNKQNNGRGKRVYSVRRVHARTALQEDGRTVAEAIAEQCNELYDYYTSSQTSSQLPS